MTKIGVSYSTDEALQLVCSEQHHKTAQEPYSFRAPWRLHLLKLDVIALCVSLVTLILLSVMTPLVFVETCSAKEECHQLYGRIPNARSMQLHSYLATFVGAFGLREMATCAAAYWQDRDPRLKSLGMPRLSTTSLIMCAILFSLFTVQSATASGFAWEHAVPPIEGLRQSWGFVHTIRYLSWQIEVPMLLLLCGHCVLRRSISEVAPAVIATSAYMYIAWWALVVGSAWLRYSLVGLCFYIYFWATWRMMFWATGFLQSAPKLLPGRWARVSCLMILNCLFAFYGVIYLLEVFEFMSSESLYDTYAVCDCSAKVMTCFFLAAFRSAEQRDALAMLVVMHTRMDRANLSLLRTSFDHLLPCRLDESGNCYILDGCSGDAQALEHAVGRPLAAVEFGELLYSQRDRELFRAQVKAALLQEGDDLIREDLAKSKSHEHAWRENEWRQRPAAVATVYNYDFQIAVHAGVDQVVRSVPVSIHLSTAIGRCGDRDSGPQMMMALRMQDEATPHDVDAKMASVSELKLPIAAAPKPAHNFPGAVSDVTSLTSLSESEDFLTAAARWGPLSLATSVKPSDVVSSHSSTMRRRRAAAPDRSAAPRHNTFTPSISTFECLSASTLDERIDADTQTIQPEVRDVATETSISWDGRRLHCRCCQKPPSIPEISTRRDSRSSSSGSRSPKMHRQFSEFKGLWSLTNAPSGVANFLTTLQIENELVTDATGHKDILKLHHSTGAITYEGGELKLENDMLVRIGKSGTRYLYARAEEACESLPTCTTTFGSGLLAYMTEADPQQNELPNSCSDDEEDKLHDVSDIA